MEELSHYIGLIAGLIGGFTSIGIFLKNAINKAFAPIYKRMDNIDINQCKNYLVTFLKAVEKGETMDDVEVQRAYEVYAHYTIDLKQNSYIHDKWEKLMK